MAGPLEGIKVVEWAVWHNGPAAGYMLGDLEIWPKTPLAGMGEVGATGAKEVVSMGYKLAAGLGILEESEQRGL